MSGVPLVDLGWQHRAISTAVAAAWERIIEDGAFIGGPDVEAFEREYAEVIGVAHCIGVANGTDAIELALRAHGIGLGDEVIVPANTFIATAEAVWRAGAVPVACDIDDDTLQMDPVDAAHRITARTAAIVPVHLHGHPAPMPEIEAVAQQHGLMLLEDAAQAQGARLHGRALGSWGDIAATSFYPGKNLGAYGDAGAVLTQSDAVAQRVRRLREHGSVRKYSHEQFGCTARLDTVQAAVLRTKLPYLAAWNERRVQAAALYSEILARQSGVRLPVVASGAEPVWHCYVVRVRERDQVLRLLHDLGIGAGIHYPVPIHRTPAWSAQGYAVPELPVAERVAPTLLSLPIYPGITLRDQEQVGTALLQALRQVA
ncbi:MAG: DegT/DnrJ/EryC1/StrS family aminotransferase [Acidimicrobiia bacterium]